MSETDPRDAGAPADPPIERACFWLADLPPRAPRPALARDETADVAIVGGGFTGLWTALFLKELAPESEVILLESERIAYGASGRNAGIVGETFDHSHALAIRHFGEDEARRLARLARDNVDEMERFLARESIDADFARVGQLSLALRTEHTKEIEAALIAARRVGIEDWQALDRQATSEAIGSSLPMGALFAPRAATVHPAKLAEGLAVAAERRGVRLHENTPVASIGSDGALLEVSARGGTLRARRVILATNAYSHRLVLKLGRRFLPLYDYVVASEPLNEKQKASIRWRGREGITDFRAFFDYARLTADDRIVWGTSEAVYHRGNGVGPQHDADPAVFAAIEKSLFRFFPDLEGLALPYRWGGPIAATTRFSPFFGSLHRGRLLYGLGYTGHGVGTTRIAGRLLAHLALERPCDLASMTFARRRPVPYPPEPLRRWAVRRVTRALERVDAGAAPSALLRLLDRLGIGFSS